MAGSLTYFLFLLVAFLTLTVLLIWPVFPYVVIAMVIAYLLHPFNQRMERRIRSAQLRAALLIVQEELVAEIADAFMEHVQPLGCVVKATGTHDCVAVRGVRAAETSMTTIVPRGAFKESFNLMEEFHRAVGGGLR